MYNCGCVSLNCTLAGSCSDGLVFGDNLLSWIATVAPYLLLTFVLFLFIFWMMGGFRK